MFCRLKESKVEVIKKYSEPVWSWNGKGLIFSVKNGKGRLREKYGAEGEQGLHCILFDDIPLIKFHGDNYFCPTCEKLIAAGCGIEKINKKTIEEIRNLTHVPFQSLEQSLNDISPLLKLLPSGYYALADVQLYPTDGDGNFFFSISNTPKLNRATAPIYDDGNWSEERPMYLLPSQSPRLFSQEAVDYYRDKPEYRAIAEVFSRMEIVESWGTGIKRIVNRAKEYGLPEPQFWEIGDTFRVNLFRKADKKPIKADRKKMILEYVQENGSISNK